MNTTEEIGIRVAIKNGAAASGELKQVADAQKQITDGVKANTQAAKEQKSTLDAYLQSLSREHAQLTLSRQAYREREAMMRGASAAQLEQVRTIGAQIDALKREQAAKEQSASANKRFWDSAKDGADSALGAIGLVTRGALVMTAAFAAFQAGAWFSAQTDEAKVTLARINGITQSLTESRAVYRGLYEDALRLRAPLQDALTGYVRIAAAVKELGGSSKQARELNELVIATAKISGVSMQEAGAAARQFAQALGSGVLQGDELRSILENNQELARQLAKGLGVGVGELRKLGEEGKLTADVVANALLSRTPEIRDKLAEVPLTSAEAWLKLKTVLTQVVIQGDQVEMKAGLIATALNNVANAIDNVNKTGGIGKTVNAVLDTHIDAARSVVAFLSGTMPELRAQQAQIEAARQRQATSADNSRRGTGVANARAIDNEIAQGMMLGLETATKNTLKEFEKYADGVALGSVRIQKALDKELKALAPLKEKWNAALGSDNPQAREKAVVELARIGELEVRAVADAQRKIADARKSEANKGMADARRDREAALREQLAHSERMVQAVDREVRSMLAVEREKFESGTTTAEQYHDAVLRVEQLGFAERKALYESQLALLLNEVRRGDKTKLDDAERVRGKLAEIKDKEIEAEQRAVSAQRALLQKLTAERLDALAQYDRAAERFTQGTADLIEGLREGNAERELERSLLGQTTEQQLRLTEAYKADLFIRRESKKALEEYLSVLARATTEEERNAATAAYENRLRGIKQVAEATRDGNIALGEQREQLQRAQGFWEGFFRAIEGGWKGLRDYVKRYFMDWLYKELARQVTLNLNVNGSQSGGGIGGFLQGLFSMFSGGSTSGASNGGGGAGAGAGGLLGGLGSLASSGLGALGSMFPSLAGITGMLSSAIPFIGPLVAVFQIAKSLFKNKDGLWFDFGPQIAATARAKGATHNIIDTQLGTIVGGGELNIQKDAPGLVSFFQSAAKSFAEVFGQSVTEKARIAIGEWTGRDNRGKGTEYENAQQYEAALKTESKDVMAEFFGRAFSAVDERFSKAILGWSGSVEDLQKYILGLINAQAALTQQADTVKRVVGEALTLKQLDDLKREGEDLGTTLTRVVSTFAITTDIANMLGQGADAFGAVGIASLEARERLITLAGGLDALANQTKYYYETFYSAEERAQRERASAQSLVNETFAKFNTAVPKSREEFRALVEGLDLSTEAGQKMFAALMRIAPAFATVTDAISTSTVAVERSREYLEAYFSEEERVAMRRGELQRQVNDEFAAFNLTVPKTREEFRALAESQDRTTESGRAAWNMLMGIADEFAELTPNANAATTALAQLNSGLTDYRDRVRSEAERRIDEVLSLIESSTSTVADRLFAQKQYLQDQLSRLAENDFARRPFEQALAQINELLNVLGRAEASAPGFGEALFELQRQYEERVRLAQGNTALLALIEQDYQRRRAEILTQGTQQGLSALTNQFRTWLNSLFLNDQLTTLTPEQRLNEAQRQYEASLRGGDASAITSAADAFLRAAREFYASSASYQAIYNRVTGDIGALAGGAPAPIGTPPAPTGTTPTPTGTTSNASGSTNAALTQATINAATLAATTTTEQFLRAIADATAKTKYAVEEQAATTRANDNANTARLETAIAAPGTVRVVP